MIRITEPRNCTGCGACHLLCPNDCISMKCNNEGFYAPHIDAANCIDCSICTERCPQNSRPSFTQDNQVLKAFGVRYKNDKLLSNSASGGVFVGIAAKVLDTSGNAVFGCAFDESIVARHVCITDMKDIMPLQSSKYVQSDIGDTFMQTKALLESGKTVFYTGCPCQIAGLYAFLGKDYDNLLTADLICHGVPSPLLFKLYIQRLSKQLGGKITGYNFRSKKKEGWSVAGEATIFKPSDRQTDRQTVPIIPSIDPYFRAFLLDKSLMEACYTCKYANVKRIADITMADFWGVDTLHPEFYDKRGVSAVLLNTQKGTKFFEAIRDNFDVFSTSVENVGVKQLNLHRPTSRPPARDAIYEGVWDLGVDIFKQPAFKISMSFRRKVHTKQMLKRVLPSIAIKMYKRIKHR